MQDDIQVLSIPVMVKIGHLPPGYNHDHRSGRQRRGDDPPDDADRSDSALFFHDDPLLSKPADLVSDYSGIRRAGQQTAGPAA